MSTHVVFNVAEIDAIERKVLDAANAIPTVLAQHKDCGLSLLRRMKFGKLGKHPTKEGDLNFIEQINQTFTILATLKAARILFEMYPDAGGFRLVLGPHKGTDILGVREGLVAAEVFSAVTTDSNDKLKEDCAKMAKHTAVNRFVFFHVPNYSEGRQQDRKDAPGVHIWAVDV